MHMQLTRLQQPKAARSCARSPTQLPPHLPRAEPLVGVVRQQLADEVSALRVHVTQQLGQPAALAGGEVKGGGVAGALLQLGQQLGWRRAHDGVDLLDLVQLVVACKPVTQAQCSASLLTAAAATASNYTARLHCTAMKICVAVSGDQRFHFHLLQWQSSCMAVQAVLPPHPPGKSGYSATTSNMTQPTPHMSIL